ncbi:LuxR C-terminal-related transcriptional regulator [Uliginosibacterium sp. H3]|uniref:LuxR C-terminal-related transcriptional regulator n=1 Tax=Uliginosibacterium silvisoli TaxID=3114758 RepID=A0ABU6JYM2_9RHOO|nr:LuxR C-terminal-related transcriptional regulator [Uliginosibacterium sp. H3]
MNQPADDNPPARSVAAAAPAGTWSGVAATKFRAPRQRRDLVSRTALLQRARGLVLDRRVTLVCAPAGFGKSTLLLQLLASIAADAESVWLSLDEDDNDINRLFVSLLGALRDVVLEWEVDPHILASQVQVAGPQSRAAIAALINALSSYQGERLLFVIDDLHRVSDADALQLLGEFIERLPPEVGVVLGSRTSPTLPLARWRARGEVGELLTADLQFDAGEARALAAARQAAGLSGELSAAFLEQALQRTQGWPAGLQLVLGAVDSQAVESMRPAVDRAAGRHLFDFFAQEVLADLPADLRDFVLQCSVLPELSPALCNAVTGRDDAHDVLDTLYRSNLFLTVLDEHVPVLRFHDLFAEFLQTRLAQRHAGLVRSLHARAARAEQVPLRAVAHFLKAGEWAEAIATMGRCVEPLLAEGGQATVARWIAQLPEAIVRDNADVDYLQALCAWGRWDFARAANFLERAALAFREQGRMDDYMRCYVLLPRACNAVGQIDRAAAALVVAETLPLPTPLQAIRQGAHAWQAAAFEPHRCAEALQAMVEHGERDVRLLLPAMDDMFNPFLFPMPGALPPMRRLRSLSREALQAGVVHWQFEAMANAAWPELWHGERKAAEEAIERQYQLTQRLSVVPMLTLNDHTMRAWRACLHGDFALAEQLMLRNIEVFASMNEGMKQSWRRSGHLCLAQVYWMAGRAAALETLGPQLDAARTAAEWPLVDIGRELFRGRLALLRERLVDAEISLQEAVRLQARVRAPSLFGDARLCLAWACLEQGKLGDAWACFAPVLQEAAEEDCLGALLFEPAHIIEKLLLLIPIEELARPRVRDLLARLGAWHAGAPDELPQTCRPAPTNASLLDALSEREREVLARIAAGDSNKLIARAFDLSPHTVKRHVANILTKLDCATRGQAAAAWRATQP